MLKINLKHIRKKKFLSQGKLSDLTGLSQGYISQLESGTKKASWDVIEQIAKDLDVCPLELLECDCSKCKGR